MPRIKLNFHQLSITDKIAKARQIVSSLTGNPAFVTPTPALATATAAIDNLETAHAESQTAKQVAKTKTSAQNEKEDVLDKIMSQVAAYVESVAGDNEETIRSAGMDTRAAAASTSGAPAQPQGLNATAGDREGEVDLAWDTVAGARSYLAEKSPDPPGNTSWTHAGVSTKSRTTISGLTSGTKYWFRVAAVGTNGQSGWSDPASRMAP
ncbi:MAG: fibronectin type III domain-containing protein [Pyrinomonadaceae bacterium]|nr:fibronectin type III domain-containing protein [Pyrinomonadaceae bacterium]